MTLRDALAEYDEFALGSVEALMSFEPVLAAAARRVAEAPEVWWCENHQELGEDDKTCTWAWENGLSIRFCRMVRKLLVDPDNL